MAGLNRAGVARSHKLPRLEIAGDVRRGAQEDYYRRMWHSPDFHGKRPNASERARLRVISDFLDRTYPDASARPRKLLDAGCGRGWLCPYLLKWGEVVGIDPMHASIDEARRLFPGMRFLVGGIDALRANSFDVVISSEVIEHVVDQETYVAGLARAVGPGGHVIITTPRRELYEVYSRAVPRSHQQPVENWLDRTGLLTICKKSGLVLLAERRLCEAFCRRWFWRVIASDRVDGRLTKIPVIRSLWSCARTVSALYLCVMLRKDEFPQA